MRISDWSSDVCSSDLISPFHHFREWTPILCSLSKVSDTALMTSHTILASNSFTRWNANKSALLESDRLLTPIDRHFRPPQSNFALGTLSNPISLRLLHHNLSVVYEIGRASCRDRVCQYV